MGRIGMLWIVALVASVGAPVPARAKQVACAPGVFVVEDGPRLAPFGGSPVPIAIGPDDRIAIGNCAAVKGTVHAGRRFTRVRARVRSCGGVRRIRLRARIAAPACTTLEGTLGGLHGRRIALSAARSPLHVITAGGIVHGTAADGVRTFLGIPYAAPPVGDRRWRPPVPPAPWTGVRDGTKPGSICPQTVPYVNLESGSEDCLFLNVFVPDPPPSAAPPVMVWIHGGAFTIGDARQIVGGTDGDTIARQTGTVVVTINYRLGQLGFLAHRALAAEDAGHPTSGNYGIEDQIAALGWVRDNVAAFGGDPARVTIFGESAGGWSVCTHLGSPRSAGLFHRAIVESGLCIVPLPTLAAAETQGDRFATLIGCAGAADVAACLRGKSTAEVRAVLPPDPSITFSPGEWGRWQPTFDGVVFPQQMDAAFTSGSFNRVPVLIGSNRDEGTLFVSNARDGVGMPVTAGEYPTLLRDFLPGDAQVTQAMTFYPLASYPTPGAALSAAFGDGFLACPTIGTAHRLAAYTPTYLYQFEYPDAPFPLPTSIMLGAYHSAEVQYVFGKRAGPGSPFSPVEENLSSTMMGYWTRFAATADPNGAGAVAWPALDAGNRHLVLDADVVAATGAKQAACDFWAGVDYLRPALQ
jgi:para-nitrobenzyl esterase